MTDFSSQYFNFISHIKNVSPNDTFFENLLIDCDTKSLSLFITFFTKPTASVNVLELGSTE